MKYYCSITLMMFSCFLVGQEDINRNELIVGYHLGRNANAYTFDDIAKPFLDEGLGNYQGLDLDYIFYTKRNRILDFSYSFSFLNHSISPSNLVYEFGYNYDDDCCLKIGSALLMQGAVKFLLVFYDRNKIKLLGGAGIGLILDISSVSGGITYEGREIWSEYDTKKGPVILPSYDISTQLNYNLTKDYLLNVNLSFIHTPFNDLDFEYTILSRDGIFRGSFYQKLSSVTLSIGLGKKL